MLCECGCGLEVKGFDYHSKRPVRFRQGHWAKTDHCKEVRNMRPCEHEEALYSERDCECGCGLQVTGWNYHKNEPTRFIRGHCNTGHFKRGTKIPIEKNPHWKGGRFPNIQGYILIRKPDHPYANSHGYVLEHRWIIEQYLKRYLSSTEHVHHKNHNRSDNRIENLQLMTSSEHSKHHDLERPTIERKYWGKNHHLR